jgi:low affinity Fe/Cu permease
MRQDPLLESPDVQFCLGSRETTLSVEGGRNAPTLILIMNHEHHKKSGWRDGFRRFAHATSIFAGSPWVFALACLVIIAWAVTGPMFHFSDTWQLVINTGTTIVTFLMVFLIQNTQNRDTRAVHLKLDELIRALKGARNQLVNLEEMSDEELDKLHEQFEHVRGARHRPKRKNSHASPVQAHGPAEAPAK